MSEWTGSGSILILFVSVSFQHKFLPSLGIRIMIISCLIIKIQGFQMDFLDLSWRCNRSHYLNLHLGLYNGVMYIITSK